MPLRIFAFRFSRLSYCHYALLLPYFSCDAIDIAAATPLPCIFAIFAIFFAGFIWLLLSLLRHLLRHDAAFDAITAAATPCRHFATLSLSFRLRRRFDAAEAHCQIALMLPLHYATAAALFFAISLPRCRCHFSPRHTLIIATHYAFSRRCHYATLMLSSPAAIITLMFSLPMPMLYFR